MQTLTEQEIKAAFLPFLREFYRYRYEYRPETEQASLDNVTSEGLIADGMLRFHKPDGEPFVCTYEATSRDKAEEVKFSLNHTYFTWDCLAFGGLVAAVVYGVVFYTRPETLRLMSDSGKLGLPLGIGLIGFFGWYFLMQRWKKYRYVYAVEQFKRYHADEQWVALAEDVFPAPTDPYFLELKDQCIYGGFGLAVVHYDRSVRLVAAPSRLGIFGGERRMAHWLTRTDFYQSMASNARAAAHFAPPVLTPGRRLLNTLLRPVRQYVWRPVQQALGRTVSPAADAYQRFTGEHTVQKWVFTLSLVVVSAFAYQAFQLREMDEAERAPRPYNVAEDFPAPSKTKAEREGYYIRNPETEVPVPFGVEHRNYDQPSLPRQYPSDSLSSGALADDEGPTLNISGGDEEDEPIQKAKGKTAKSKSATPNNQQSTTNNQQSSWCSAGGWYIQDNHFSTVAFANDRVKALRAKGIVCAALSASCLGQKGWIVRLGYQQPSEAAARAKAADYAAVLKKNNLNTGAPLVRKIASK